jgi:hypothetical protein
VHGGLVEYALQGFFTKNKVIVTSTYASRLNSFSVWDSTTITPRGLGWVAASTACVALLYVQRGTELHAICIDGMLEESGKDKLAVKTAGLICCYDSWTGTTSTLCADAKTFYLFISTLDGMRTAMVAITPHALRKDGSRNALAFLATTPTSISLQQLDEAMLSNVGVASISSAAL